MPRQYAPLTRIRIQNFQSLADATIEMGRLVVLIGPGDAGKSAVLRAMRAAFLNDGDDLDIRHGEKRCTVDLFFTDGVNITWWKQKGQGGCYRMQDSDPERVFTKTGGQVPQEVSEYLGIGRIEVDATTELTPQLSDQHDFPFVVWETGSKRARILGKATRLDTVVSAQMLCKKELDKARRDAEEKAKALTQVEESLAALPDYEALEGRLDTTEENLKVINDNITLAARARELADQIAEVRSRATVVDVVPLRERLDEAAEALELADRVKFLSRRIPDLVKEIADLAKRRADHQEALDSFQVQLNVACDEAGVCVTCQGLLNHDQCNTTRAEA